MQVLAIDTALSSCSVAIFNSEHDNHVSQVQSMQRGQAEHLVPLIIESMDKAGVTFEDLDLIAVTTGPGAFTGVRVGIATAQGFGVALDKPVIGVTTIDVFKETFFKKEKLENTHKLAVVIESKRDDFYFAAFDHNGDSYIDPCTANPQQIAEMLHEQDVVYIGDGVSRLRDASSEIDTELPDPTLLAEIAIQRYQSSVHTALEPVYLRDADVSSPKKQPRVLLEEK